MSSAVCAVTIASSVAFATVPAVAKIGHSTETVTLIDCPIDKLKVPSGSVTLTFQPAKSIMSFSEISLIELVELFLTTNTISLVCPGAIVSFKGAVTVKFVICLSENFSIAFIVQVSPAAKFVFRHSKAIALSCIVVVTVFVSPGVTSSPLMWFRHSS